MHGWGATRHDECPMAKDLRWHSCPTRYNWGRFTTETVAQLASLMSRSISVLACSVVANASGTTIAARNKRMHTKQFVSSCE